MSDPLSSADLGEQRPSRVRSLATGVFLPHSFMAIGQGATVPVIALLAIELGASDAGAGVVVGMFGLGAFLGDVPGGILASRFGDRRMMMAATGMMCLSAAAVALRPPLIVFAVLVALMGTATATFALGRISYATELSPVDRRGRVMSAIGGTQRIGLFIGPALGGLTIGSLGLTGPFLIHSGMGLIAFLTIFVSRTRRDQSAPSATLERPTLGGVLKDHRKTLATAGIAVVAVQIVRSSRQVVIPLWGTQIGLDASQIALLFSLSAGMEVLMFYPIGHLMDRKGRKWAAIPSLTLMSIGMMTIPFTSSALSLSLVAAVLGFANGMGTGINMTLSSDLSPPRGRSVFLGVWRMITDAGTATGPSLVAAVTSLAGLALASTAVAGVGIGGVLLLWLAVPETLQRGASVNPGGCDRGAPDTRWAEPDRPSSPPTERRPNGVG